MIDNRLPGDLGVCSIAGPGGVAIEVLEAIGGDGFKRWHHAKVYVGDGMVLQAEPTGAQIVPSPLEPGELWSTGLIDIPPAQRARVPQVAERYRGIGYSWLDYAALAAHKAHAPDLPTWVERDGWHLRLVTLRTFIEDTGHMMCSQLADRVMLDLGVHLFDDNRWEGFVMPADLGILLEGLRDGAR